MGQVVRVGFTEILPGEQYFFRDIMHKLIEFMKSGERILPVPSREIEINGAKKKLHLDGRHRLLLRKMQGLDDAEIYVAEHNGDVMTRTMFPYAPEETLRVNNRNIYARWNVAKESFTDMQKRGIDDFNDYFNDIVARHPFMSDVDSFLRDVRRRGLRELY